MLNILNNEIKVEYEQIKATDTVIEARLFGAFSMLISEDDLYELINLIGFAVVRGRSMGLKVISINY